MLNPTGYHQATDEQVAAALDETEKIIDKLKQLCLKCDLPLSELRLVTQIFGTQLSGIVMEAQIKADDERNRKIAKIMEMRAERNPVVTRNHRPTPSMMAPLLSYDHEANDLCRASDDEINKIYEDECKGEG